MFSKRATITLIILCLFYSYVHTQIIQVPFQRAGEKAMPAKFTEYTARNTFISVGQYHKAFLVLNGDSTFELHNLTDESFDLTLGTYHIKKKTICFIWDSIPTYTAAHDTSIYKKYFGIRKPYPLRISKTIFTLATKHKKREIERQLYNRIEIFFSPQQVFTHGLICDSLKEYAMPFYQGVAKNQFILFKKNKTKLIFPLDSVFAYRWIRRDGVSGHVIRGGLELVQYTEGFTIYSHSVPSSRGTNYFYYFSKTIDGPISPLDKEHLIASYQDNPAFIKHLKNDSNLTMLHYLKGMVMKDEKGEFRIMTVYKKSLKDNSAQG